jgi:hypothetical protein
MLPKNDFSKGIFHRHPFSRHADPDAVIFYQINALAAAVLYSLIRMVDKIICIMPFLSAYRVTPAIFRLNTSIMAARYIQSW